MTQSSAAEPRGIDRIIPEMAVYGSEFARNYANHAPMVLVALSNLGGSEQRLYEFFEFYRDYKQLLPFVPEVAPVDRSSWESCIGHREREADLRRFFASEVNRLGVKAALATYLPRLAPGIAASAFHALMRMAYGLLRMDKSEIANALAYWTATYLKLPDSTGAAPITDDPAEVLARVTAIPALHGLPVQELIWHNIRQFAAVPEFQPVVDWLEIKPDTTQKMAAAALAVFAGSMGFCALHGVTGMHWMRIVMPYCPTPDVMLRYFWLGIAGALGEMGFPRIPSAEELDEWRQIKTPDWPEIKRAAIASNDEHDLSLVFSASEEEKVYPDPLYRLVAARRVNLLPFPA
ncbi:MAG: questin oxidase family protein [Devosia sp.]|nr:questin oxidase family protein [Devosia sp.]